MKHLYKLGLCLGSFFLVTACDYEPLEFDVEKPVTIVAQEEIDAYGDLKTYINKDANAGFKLGTGVTFADYNQKGVLYRLIGRNFNEITPVNNLKHGAIVQADGTLNVSNLKVFFETAKEAGVTVFGQSLVSHTNQNATYLNGLLSPLLVESPAFANALNTNNLKAGNLNEYTTTGSGASVTVEDNEGMGSNAKAVKLKSGAGANAPTDLQFETPSIPVVQGHEYEVVFYIKSDVAGEGRVTFEGLKNNTPQKDWMGTGKASATFVTGPGWKRVRFKISDFDASAIKMRVELGYKPNVTYLMDVNNLFVYDTQGDPLITNLVASGDFETGTGWGGWGPNSTRGITASGMGVNNTGKAFFVTNTAKATNFWDIQTSYEFAKPLDNAKAYKLTFWVKGTAAGTIRPELQSADYSSNGFGTVNVTTDWQLVTLTTTTTAATRSRLLFSYGEYAGTVYIDNVVLSTAVSVGGTTIVQKTSTEKDAIISEQMENWMAGILSASKEYVMAWEVVSEPMDDAKPAELKTSMGKTLTPSEFYWQDYMGKDYAVKAFQLARKYGNEKDLLFIGDNNLEQNLDKCRGLIAYVSYLEGKGVKIDGISAKMNININTDKQNIATMLQLLAGTGKMVRISDLNVSLGVTANETTLEHYQAQKGMYQYVVEKYAELVPAKQRYGIAVANPLDNSTGLTGLWTDQIRGYVRKPAYSGFADGLKGLK